jgi:hypothetical protein
MNVDAINTDDSTALHAIRMAVRASGSVTDMAGNLADSIPADNQGLIGGWNGPTGIRHIYPHTLFNKSPVQLRRIGALGGKAYARNQRARRALMPTPPPATPLGNTPRQSTAEAVAALDAQFPWLRYAEKRIPAEVRDVPDRPIKPTSHRTIPGRPGPAKGDPAFICCDAGCGALWSWMLIQVFSGFRFPQFQRSHGRKTADVRNASSPFPLP